jgi:hypothetical protein
VGMAHVGLVFAKYLKHTNASHPEMFEIGNRPVDQTCLDSQISEPPDLLRDASYHDHFLCHTCTSLATHIISELPRACLQMQMSLRTQ